MELAVPLGTPLGLSQWPLDTSSVLFSSGFGILLPGQNETQANMASVCYWPEAPKSFPMHATLLLTFISHDPMMDGCLKVKSESEAT